MSTNDFEELKNSNDPYEYHLIGRFYYRAGTFGLGKYNKKFEKVGHSNDFRNKDFKTVIEDLKQEL